MKKLIFFILIAGAVWSQPIYQANTLYPFIAGNDTILSAANLYSVDLFIGNRLGAQVLAIQADTMAGGGTVAKDIKIYAKFKIDGLNWGVPMDSIDVDSLEICTYDSADVNNEIPMYIDLANQSWWSWFDFMKVTLDPAASADSIRIVSRLKGQ